MKGPRWEFSQRAAKVPRYPAASSYAKNAIALASNESPFPPLPAVVDAIKEATGLVHRYPDPSGRRLRDEIAQHHDFPIEQIGLGNGADDLLITIASVLLDPGEELIYPWPSFSVYPHISATTRAQTTRIPLDEDLYLDLDKVAAAVSEKTRLVILCNPNNPTSTAVSLDRIQSFMRKVPLSVPVLIDEAYCHFNRLCDQQAPVQLLREHPNLVLVRTFSKAFGLAGLRVGYGLFGDLPLLDAANRYRPPFFCNVLGQIAAVAALNNYDQVAERVDRILASRAQLLAGLQELGFSPPDSQTNFCFVPLNDGHDEKKIVSELAEQGIIVRAGTPLGYEGSLRVTAGTEQENQTFLTALAKLL